MTVDRPIYPGGDCPPGQENSVPCVGNVDAYWQHYQPEIMEQYREKNPGTPPSQ